MNYLPFVSWGMFGGASAKQRSNFFASWGLMADLPRVVTALFLRIVTFYRRLKIS